MSIQVLESKSWRIDKVSGWEAYHGTPFLRHLPSYEWRPERLIDKLDVNSLAELNGIIYFLKPIIHKDFSIITIEVL
jgi:hypothetical protein